jgi:hypothetical protein
MTMKEGDGEVLDRSLAVKTEGLLHPERMDLKTLTFILEQVHIQIVSIPLG